MKVRLTMDDALRVFICRGGDWGVEVEVPEDLIKRFEEADRNFRAVDDELYSFLEKVRENNPYTGG